MTDGVRVMIERGPKGKKVVACAIDWPGWSRGAKPEEAALEVLESYRSRYQPIAKLAGLEPEFESLGGLEFVERIEGTGSTDFWGMGYLVLISVHRTRADERGGVRAEDRTSPG